MVKPPVFLGGLCERKSPFSNPGFSVMATPSKEQLLWSELRASAAQPDFGEKNLFVATCFSIQPSCDTPK